MEKEEKGKKTKTSGKTVIIIILTILLLGALGFIGYDKFLVNDEVTPITEKKQKGEKTLDSTIKKLTKDSQEVKDLMNTFVHTYSCDDQDYLFKLNEKSAKLYMAYTRAHNVQKISCSKVRELIYNSHTCGNLRNEVYSYFDNFGRLTANDALNERLKNEVVGTVNKAEFDKKMKELFGEDINYSYDDITIGMGCNLIHYDQSIESYIEYTGYNCGGTCGGNTTSLKDISQNGENLTLIVDISEENETTKTMKYNFKLEKDNYIFVNME